MHHLDDLPKRDNNHGIETKAIAAFQALLASSGDVFIQVEDCKDYGTDYQVEVTDQGRATNVRIHVQLKGTTKDQNVDGSVSVEVSRTNLNYLLMHSYSIYACYHVQTQRLLICPAADVLRQYEHGGTDWSRQQTLTVNFSEPLTHERLKSLAVLARRSAGSSRNRRVRQSTATAKDVPDIIKGSVPDVHVPEDARLAAEMLASLYGRGADAAISAAFDQFTAILGADHDAMGYCFMTEINLGMAGKNTHPTRIEDGISHLNAKLGTGRYQVGSLHYSIGNAFSALGREEEAVASYEIALVHLSPEGDPHISAQCLKNLGSSIEKLGNEGKAADLYREALRLDPHLGEAHFALGSFYHRSGRFDDALTHFDMVVLAEGALGTISSVAGQRINVLFNLDEPRNAFREINSLLGEAENEIWIWLWCARQVATFGRTSVENAKLAVPFWQRYVQRHAGGGSGERELLLAKLYLRANGQDIGATYEQFRTEFETGIRHVKPDAAAFLWDRLGHWAQDERDWADAERCFRKAYDSAGGHYGYCLGTALNFLKRYEESLAILLPQAKSIQPDAKSWFQVAVAYEHLNQVSMSVEGYRRAIALDPNYALAWFNLGGVHWNSCAMVDASQVWKEAVRLFPDHELASKLRAELPFVLL